MAGDTGDVGSTADYARADRSGRFVEQVLEGDRLEAVERVGAGGGGGGIEFPLHLNIDRLSTLNQQGPTTLFHPFIDGLTLTMDVNAGGWPSVSGVVYQAQFQIVSFKTGEVIVTRLAVGSLPGRLFSLSAGNSTVPPYDTPADFWGLVWPTQGDIFGFRATIELSVFRGEDGTQAVDALAVADPHWFRLKTIARL
jgi:hypothetical protein